MAGPFPTCPKEPCRSCAVPCGEHDDMWSEGSAAAAHASHAAHPPLLLLPQHLDNHSQPVHLLPPGPPDRGSQLLGQCQGTPLCNRSAGFSLQTITWLSLTTALLKSSCDSCAKSCAWSQKLMPCHYVNQGGHFSFQGSNGYRRDAYRIFCVPCAYAVDNTCGASSMSVESV